MVVVLLTAWLTEWLVAWLVEAWLAVLLTAWLTSWLEAWLTAWLEARLTAWLTEWLVAWFASSAEPTTSSAEVTAPPAGPWAAFTLPIELATIHFASPSAKPAELPSAFKAFLASFASRWLVQAFTPLGSFT